MFTRLARRIIHESRWLNLYLLLCFFAAITSRVASAEQAATPDAETPRQLSALVLKSSSVTIEREYGSNKAPIDVRDRAWIEEFAKVLGKASYVPQLHGFRVSPGLSFRDEKGRTLLSLAISGSTLRLERGDFDVGEKTAAELAALVRKKGD